MKVGTGDTYQAGWSIGSKLGRENTDVETHIGYDTILGSRRVRSNVKNESISQAP